MKIAGKRIVVTGASSGIGEAVARLLAAEGARVALGARRADRLEALASEIRADGGEAIVVPTDVTVRAEVEGLVRAATAAFGGVDIVVNNAGVMPLSMMRNLHVDEWDRMIDVNVKGVLYGIAAVLPDMLERGSGHIVNISSVAGRRLFPGGTVYCGTKFAVTAISEGLRAELAGSGIRVTVIEPGAVATELTDSITDDDLPEFPPIRVLDSEDIARSVLYAVSQPEHVNVSEVLVMPTEQKN